MFIVLHHLFSLDLSCMISYLHYYTLSQSPQPTLFLISTVQTNIIASIKYLFQITSTPTCKHLNDISNGPPTQSTARGSQDPHSTQYLPERRVRTSAISSSQCSDVSHGSFQKVIVWPSCKIHVQPVLQQLCHKFTRIFSCPPFPKNKQTKIILIDLFSDPFVSHIFKCNCFYAPC